MNNRHFTHAPIAGIEPKIILPKGCALVLEGGGTRGFYSAGVFEAFMGAGVMFPYIIGVSAGAANAISYISGQRGRNRQVVAHYVGDPRYVSRRNLLLHRSMFNMDFIFHTVPERHIAVDWDMYNRQDIRFLTGAMNCETGKSVWFEKEDIKPPYDATIASCSVPLISPIVHYKGYALLDGGITDPIPIEKSIEEGNTFHTVVLTRNPGYVKSAFTHKAILRLFYRKHPKVIEAMLTRHETYMRQLALCERLASEGKAVIIRPLLPIQVGRTGTDIEKLLALYDEGEREGKEQMARILAGAQCLG